jgi:hypothetical protein
VLPGLTMGLDAYYKNTRDQIDDGQFGAAVVLTQFNYARGYSEGGEFKLKYSNGKGAFGTGFLVRPTPPQSVDDISFVEPENSNHCP